MNVFNRSLTRIIFSFLIGKFDIDQLGRKLFVKYVKTFAGKIPLDHLLEVYISYLEKKRIEGLVT